MQIQILFSRVPVLNKLLRGAIGLLVAVSLLAGCANSTPKTANIELPTVIANQHFEHVRVVDGNKLPRVTKLYVEPTTVEMSDYWLLEFRGDYTDRDLTRIKTTYANLLEKSLIKAFDKTNKIILVANKNDADAILVPALQALNIYAPDLSFQARIDSFSREAGNAVINFQITDLQGKPLAQLIDASETFSSPAAMTDRADRATNARRFSRLMDRWSNNLVKSLTE